MAQRFPEPGMNDQQAAADRKGFQTTMEMVTGKGRVVAANDGGGPEVGNPYDTTLMGEDYMPVTYPSSEPDWGGASMGASATQERITTAGNKVASAPQNRTTFGGSKE